MQLKLKDLNMFASFIIVCFFVCFLSKYVSSRVNDLLSTCIESQLVNQLYVDKSLMLHAHNLTFFISDLQTVTHY